MKKFQIILTKKQNEAWDALCDEKTNEILFGGGAGGGKSFLGCLWLISMCQMYPKTRWLMGRAILKNLKESTLKTFVDIIFALGWEKFVKINFQSGFISFTNGSEIILKDLFSYPSDQNFDSLGSTEYTGAFIDEASQISEKAKNIVLSRIRYKLDENDLVPKLLICSNPSKNWMYYDFFKPFQKGVLKGNKIFIQSLVGDNPNISKHYVGSLQNLDSFSKERLLFGNWEYDDGDGKLFKYEKILDMFSNSFVVEGDKFITADVARMGSDKCVIYFWNGFRVEKSIVYDLSLGGLIKKTISELAEKYCVPRSNIIIDQDGVGGYLVDDFEGCVGFVNNGRAQGGFNFLNLKSQCYFKLSEMINGNQIFFGVDDIEIKNKLIEDLEQIRQKNADKDGKLAIIGKDEIKKRTGRSTDFSDALMMRMLPELVADESFDVGESLNVCF